MTRHYNLLGPLEITSNGQASDLINSPKGCGLLAYLIITKQTHPREYLADLFWEANSTAQALRNLRALLVRTRNLVPEFQITRSTVAFQTQPDTRVDLHILQTVLDHPTGKIEAPKLDAALQHYRGDLLDKFYLDDAPRFEEWLVLERERLRRQVLKAHKELSAVYMETEQWGHG